MSLNIFSFRAEFQKDAELFVKAACGHGYTVADTILVPLKFTDRGIERCNEGDEATCPDVYFQFGCNATLEQLRVVMFDVIDSHIMNQSMRQCPLTENSLERDNSVDLYDESKEPTYTHEMLTH